MSILYNAVEFILGFFPMSRRKMKSYIRVELASIRAAFYKETGFLNEKYYNMRAALDDLEHRCGSVEDSVSHLEQLENEFRAELENIPTKEKVEEWLDDWLNNGFDNLLEAADLYHHKDIVNLIDEDTLDEKLADKTRPTDEELRDQLVDLLHSL